MGCINTVAIIGGGVAGLSTGGLLTRQGVCVKLFEAGDKIGGCCGTTTIGGSTFNDGALYLALPTMCWIMSSTRSISTEPHSCRCGRSPPFRRRPYPMARWCPSAMPWT
jgi:predicted NAD/FAD-binding protein